MTLGLAPGVFVLHFCMTELTLARTFWGQAMTFRWGILGASRFAAQHMGPAIHAAKGNELVAVATSSVSKAEPFQRIAPQISVFEDYDALLESDVIDAIYVPLPNHMHVPWSVKALEAGKHVLCEKPITLKADQFEHLISARDASGKHVAEALMIAHHPQFHRAKELVQGGAIGALRHVDAVFSFNNAGDVENIRHDPTKGGGGLYDIGVYTCSAARLVSGEEPNAITLSNLQKEHGVDVYAQFAAEFSSFSMSSMVSMRLHNRQEVVFHGDMGWLKLSCPFNANVYDVSELTLETAVGQRTQERWPSVNQYVLQVENFAKTAQSGAEYPCPLEFSRGTQNMLDMIFEAHGAHPAG